MSSLYSSPYFSSCDPSCSYQAPLSPLSVPVEISPHDHSIRSSMQLVFSGWTNRLESPAFIPLSSIWGSGSPILEAERSLSSSSSCSSRSSSSSAALVIPSTPKPYAAEMAPGSHISHGSDAPGSEPPLLTLDQEGHGTASQGVAKQLGSRQRRISPPRSSLNIEAPEFCPASTSAPASSSALSTHPRISPHVLYMKSYKTELCKNFEERGACCYGVKCQFAHGEKELKGRVKHINYKTAACKNWMEAGNCHYNERCNFRHGEEGKSPL